MKQGRGITMVLVCCGIVAVALNVIVFAVPFFHGPVFWLSYLFLWVGIAAVAGSNVYLYRRAQSARSGLYRTSVVAIGIAYLIAVSVACLAFMANPFVPTWIVLIVEVAMLAICLLTMIAGGGSAGYADHIDAQSAQQTSMMGAIKQQADNALTFASTAETKSSVSHLVDALKYSDPVSSAATVAYEQQIMGIVSQISGSAASGDAAATKNLCDQAEKLLQARNTAALSSKRR